MRVSDIAELLLLSALWGGSFLFLRLASPALGPIWLIEGRVLIAGFALLPLLMRMYGLGVLWRHWRSLLVIGLLNSALPFVLISFASLSLPAGFTSIVNATTPLFGTGVAFVWLREMLTLQRAIGFGLGFAGVVVLVGWNTTTITPMFIGAVAAGLVASLMYAIAAPFAKQRLSNVPPLVITTGGQLSAAILLLPALPFTRPDAPPSAVIVLSVLALALLCTSLAYILYFRLITHIGSTKALSVTYLVPIFAMLWGAIALHEPITRSMLVGGSLILLGTAIANEVFTVRLSHQTPSD